MSGSSNVGSVRAMAMACTAADVMTKAPLVTVAPDATLSDAARLLHDHQIGVLPVVAGDDVVGVLSTADLLRTF